MGKRRKGTRLGLHQSKEKRKKERVVKRKEHSNDVASTIAYSYHLNTTDGTPTVGYEEKKVSEYGGDRELAEMLD